MMIQLQKKLEKVGVDYNGQQWRVPCNGHVINLVVQAFFLGKHPDGDLGDDEPAEGDV